MALAPHEKKKEKKKMGIGEIGEIGKEFASLNARRDNFTPSHFPHFPIDLV